jgi:hypothetical protein
MNMPVNKSVFSTKTGVSHDLVEDCDFFIVLLSMLIELVNHFKSSEFFLHLLINQRKIKDILSSIIDHILDKWSPLPEFIIVSHLQRYLMLLGMRNIYIVLE